MLGTLLIMNMSATTPAKAAVADIKSCEDSADPVKSAGTIITTLEEQIGSPTAPAETTPGEKILNCFRETTCASATNKTSPECESKIVSTCVIAEDCKRVQVYFSDSGAGLLYSYAGRIYKWAAGTIGIVAVLFIVWGGVEIASAGGDSGKIEKAKERIMQSIGGLVILFLSALILYTINPNFFTNS